MAHAARSQIFHSDNMPHAYTEDRLIEQSAIGLFAELGWKGGHA
jgi:hypothetical protein